MSLMDGEGKRNEFEEGDFERELDVDGVAVLVGRAGVMDVIHVRGQTNDDSSFWAGMRWQGISQVQSRKVLNRR
jgi:hypothetical protein